MVSIVIPHHNRVALLIKAPGTVERQRLTDWEEAVAVMARPDPDWLFCATRTRAVAGASGGCPSARWGRVRQCGTGKRASA